MQTSFRGPVDSAWLEILFSLFALVKRVVSIFLGVTKLMSLMLLSLRMLSPIHENASVLWVGICDGNPGAPPPDASCPAADRWEKGGGGGGGL
jgi:hypothetical protein